MVSWFFQHMTLKNVHRAWAIGTDGLNESVLKGTSVRKDHLAPAGHRSFKAGLKSMSDLDCDPNPSHSVVVGMRMARRSSYISMCGSQLVDCLGRMRRCGLVGGGMPQGVDFEVSKAQSCS